MQRSPDTDRAPRAFTLVELLVGMAVLALLVVMLSTVFGQISAAWIRSEGATETRRSARALVDFIGAELRGAVLPIESPTDVSRGGNLQFLHNLLPTAPGGTRRPIPDAYRNADALFWQAPLATETSFGELAEIGYFVKWEAPDPLNKPDDVRPLLCRFFVNPSTLKSGVAAPNSDFLIYDRDPKAWLTEELLKRLAPATKIGPDGKASAYLGLFAENVLGFWARCYKLDGRPFDEKPADRHFDSRTGYNHYFVDPRTGKKDDLASPRHLPAKVEISIAQIDSRTAERMTPVWQELQAISREPDVRNADEYFARLTESTNPAIIALLPGVRTHSTVVQLENSR